MFLFICNFWIMKAYFSDILYSNNNIIYIKVLKCIELKKAFDKNKVDGKKILVSTFNDILSDNEDVLYNFNVDMSNITLSHIESELSLLRNIVKLFCKCETNLPVYCDVVNVPYSFSTIWKLISQFISKDGQSKIRIYQNDNVNKAILYDVIQ